MKIKISKSEWESLGKKSVAAETDIQKLAAIVKERVRKCKAAINEVNNGAQLNTGMQAAPTELTNQQTNQLSQHDFSADLDAEKSMGMSKWKNQLTPDIAKILQKVNPEMARKMKQAWLNTLDPKSKAALQRVMEVGAENPSQALLMFKSIMNGINKRMDRKPMQNPNETINPAG